MQPHTLDFDYNGKMWVGLELPGLVLTSTYLRGEGLGGSLGPLLGPSPNLQSDCVVCGENCCKMRAGGTICRV